jgi:hypothetical protein
VPVPLVERVETPPVGLWCKPVPLVERVETPPAGLWCKPVPLVERVETPTSASSTTQLTKRHGVIYVDADDERG